MSILTKSKIEASLREYYRINFAKRPADIWYNQPALNVWVFRCGEAVVTLKCHPVTGTVTETREDIK